MEQAIPQLIRAADAMHELDGLDANIHEALVRQERFELDVVGEPEEVRSGWHRLGRSDADLLHCVE
jgi:hypothetical protein